MIKYGNVNNYYVGSFLILKIILKIQIYIYRE